MKRTRKCYRQTDGGMDIPITPFHFPAGDKQVTPGAGSFLVTGHNLNKLGRGPLGDATYHGIMVSDKKIFFMFFPK